MTFEEFSDVKNLRKIIYFVGCLNYFDINHKLRTTQYCWQLIYSDINSGVTVSRASKLNKFT